MTSAPSWALHPLKGELEGRWALTVNGNWRMVFTFEGENAVLVDYRDQCSGSEVAEQNESDGFALRPRRKPQA